MPVPDNEGYRTLYLMRLKGHIPDADWIKHQDNQAFMAWLRAHAASVTRVDA